MENAELRRLVEELRVRVVRLEKRLDSLEPETMPGPPTASSSPVLDAVGDALEALGFVKGE